MLFERMVRAARLDVNLYEEVEADSTLTTQAATVVAIVAVCQGLGNAISSVMSGESSQVAAGLVGGVVVAFVGWLVWGYVTYFIGTRLFGGTATPGEMLRTIGFAQTPNALGIALFVPCIGPLVALAGAIWALVAVVVAIRQALDFDTGKAIGTAVVGWLILIAVNVVLRITLGIGI